MSQKKQIFKISMLKKLVADENSCVSLVRSTRLLALPPLFLNDMKSGIFYQLNSLLKKYDRSLDGLVIGYQNIKVLMDENTGIIPIGASETEVNISVEFYIFQPKIGSYLEGVVNKKSNTHIGCLVHQYFNATILKPEDVFYEDWNCKDLNVDDKIIFRVKDLDFTTLLPYIEGIYDGGILLGKTLIKTNSNCDTENVIPVNTSYCYNVSVLSEFSRDKTIVDKDVNNFISSKQSDNQSEKDVTSNMSNSNEFEKDESIEETKKKKKKKKREKVELPATSNENFGVKESCVEIRNKKIKRSLKENSSNDKEVISNKSDLNLLISETPVKKKKKKQEDADDKKEELPNDLPRSFNNKLTAVEDENSNDFVKTSKSKKDKKKKKKNENDDEISPLSNKISECLPPQRVDESVLCSTQLEPTLGGKKMRTSFCSPIPQTIPSEVKGNKKSTTTESLLNINRMNQESLSETEVEKKSKKRKKEKPEEELEDSPATKKTKTSSTSFSSKVENSKTKVNSGGENSLDQSVTEKLFQQQLNRVREELNMSSSDKESCKGEKRKREVKKEKKLNGKKSLNVSSTSQVNLENTAEYKSLLEKLLSDVMQRAKKELGMSNEDSVKGSKKSRVKTKKKEGSFTKDETMEQSLKNKETANAQMNGTKEPEKMSDLENVTDNLIKQKLNVGTEESSKLEGDRGKGKKKKKTLGNKNEASEEVNQNSLLDKLLNEAKRVVLLDQNSVKNVLQSGEKEKKDEVSNLTASYSKKKDSKKKNKEKKQKLECSKTTDQPKNGSMYDVARTPEKRNPDSSLFSDSEQSHLSPVKKPKEMNGKPEKPMVQSRIDDYCKGDTKRLKSESDKESVKGTEKKKKKQKKLEKSETQNVEVESLCEKLLKEAKRLVSISEESTPTKKEKKVK